jgi:catechol-2,3-dioxygenase
LNIARNLCNGENKLVFNATKLNSIEEIRYKFSEYIDHIVLTVKDIDVTVQFYESALGIVVETFGEGRR